MPSLNQGQYIGEAIRSVVSQDYSNIELIVVDGGSTDNTPEVIAQYSGRIAHMISEKDEGQADAINKGFRLATGDIITWLNSDDLYQRGALHKVAEIFGATQLDILHGRALLFGKGRERVVGPLAVLTKWQYLSYMRFPQPASFYSRRIAGKVFPLDTRLHYGMDFELASRAVLAGAGIKASTEIFASYRLHSGSKSLREDAFLHDWAKILANTMFSIGRPGYAEELVSLNLTDGADRKYESKIHVTDDEAREVFLDHLHVQFHTRYRLGQNSTCERIAAYLAKNYPLVYKARQYSKYLTRLRLARGPVMRWIKRLK